MTLQGSSSDEALFQPGVEAYAEASTTPEPPYFADLAAETVAVSSQAQMMVGTLEGRFLKMLVWMLQPRLVLEVGTFTGYSSLSMAEALPEGGRIITCDVNAETTAIARRHAERAGLAECIDYRLGPALDTIATLDGPFDFVFLDADKANLAHYYEAVLPKLSARGVIAVDNVLWSGRVLDDRDQSKDTRALVAFNEMVARDPRVEAVMLTVRDGVTLIRKRGSA